MEITDYIIQPYIFFIFMLIFSLFNSTWLIGVFIFVLAMLLRYNQKSESYASLEVSRKVDGKRFKETDRIKIKLHVKNISDIIYRGELVDQLPDVVRIWEGSNIFLLNLEPGEEIVVGYEISFSTRGKYLLGPIRARYHSKGEYHHHIETFDLVKQVLIIPIPDQVSSYNLHPSFLTTLGGAFRSKLVGDGINFAGIREYQVGDTYRRINWKQSAKFGTLYSNEFEIDRASNIVIVLDLTEEEKEIADASVRAALGLASYLLNYRCKIALVTLGEYVNVLPLKGGKLHLIEMTELLTITSSTNKINNMDLFKIRIRDGLKKLRGEKNEILLFSTMNMLEKAIFMVKYLSEKGRLTILAPSASPYMESSDPKLQFAKKMLDLRKSVIINYLFSNKVKLFEWVPGIPFDISVSQWRKQA